MKEAISELRSTIRRLRPHLSLHSHVPRDQHPPRHEQSAPPPTSTQTTLQKHPIVSSSTAAAAADSTITATGSSFKLERSKEEDCNPQHNNAEATQNTNNDRHESSSATIIGEMQLEAASELVDAIASFIWNLDCLWDSSLSSFDSHGMVDAGDGGGDAIIQDGGNNNNGESKNDRGEYNSGNDSKMKQSQFSINEPCTEWNDEAKSLIREGYGLIVSSSSSSSGEDDQHSYTVHIHHPHHHPHHDNHKRQQQEAMRTLVRTSILDLLPSLSTSACRHFLLAFLPHFMPLTLLLYGQKEGGDEHIGDDNGNDWSPPSWMVNDDGEGGETDGVGLNRVTPMQHQQHQQNVPILERSDADAITQVLETFQSLIQSDPSTLVPFLATLSLLFESVPAIEDEEAMVSDSRITVSKEEGINGSHNEEVNNHGQQSNAIASSTKTTSITRTDDARKQCFHLCLSSLPSISEHDLPSLLHSLFILVRNQEEGRLAMEAVRQEWISVCGSGNENGTIPHIHKSFPGIDDRSNNIKKEHKNINSVLFIGNVIIQSMLSEQMPGSRHLAGGFLHTLKHSMHLHILSCAKQTSSCSKEELPPFHTKVTSTFHITTLDIIILTALYSNRLHQRNVESIVDQMIVDQNFSFVELINTLIQSWLPTNGRKSGKEQINMLLYEPLASPLISLMFYTMMSSASSREQYSYAEYTLLGGILPFRHASSSAFTKNGALDIGSDAPLIFNTVCCEVFSKLYSAVDPQRQEQIVNSLLSMMSDSFVHSRPFSKHMQKRKHRWQQRGQPASYDPGLNTSEQNYQLLLASACAACRTLLLISTSHASNISQIKGIILDRLLLLASMSASMSSTFEEKEDEDRYLTHYLFDMNCALMVALLQDDSRNQQSDHDGESVEENSYQVPTVYDTNGASELLILCQKFLFSANITAVASYNLQHRTICGMALASRLVRCKHISRSERGNIWSWVLTILSASPSFSSNTAMTSTVAPIQALDPVIAHWGLTFLNFASVSIPTSMTPELSQARQPTFPEITKFVDTNAVCGQSDVFRQVNKMLATAAIIQMEGSLKLPLFMRNQSNSTNSHQLNGVVDQHKDSESSSLTFLAYGQVPEHFCMHNPLRKNKSTPSPGMVICAPYFLYSFRKERPQRLLVNGSDSLLSKMHTVANYVYDLVDQYLELGRQNTSGALSSKSSSWNPRNWLMAKIQLPCCLPASAAKLIGMQIHSLELDAELNEISNVKSASSLDLNVNSSNQQGKWKLLLAEVLDGKKTNSTLIPNLVEFLNCIIVSIGVSSAVLKHAHNHFQSQCLQHGKTQCESAVDASQDAVIVTDGDKKLERKKRKQTEGLRKLLQFQLAKIFDMHRICRTVYATLEGVHSEVSKTGIIHPSKELPEKVSPRQELLCRVAVGKSGVPNGNIAGTVDNPSKSVSMKLQRSRVIRTHGKNKIPIERKQIPLSEINSLLVEIKSFLTSKINHTQSSILWDCLMDDVDDSILFRGMDLMSTGAVRDSGKTRNTQTTSPALMPGVCRIIRLRRAILSQLQHNIIQLKQQHALSHTHRPARKHGANNSDWLHCVGRDLSRPVPRLDSRSLHGLGRVFRMAMSITSYLNRISKKQKSTWESEWDYSGMKYFVCAHYKLLLAAFSFAAEGLPLSLTITDGIVHFKNKKELENNTQDTSNSIFADAIQECSSMTTDMGISLELYLIQRLEHCEDASIVCHVIDLLSLILIHSECPRGVLTKTTRAALDSIYTVSDGSANLPYAFFKSVHFILDQAHEDDDANRAYFVREAFSSFLRMSNTLQKSKDSFTATFIHHVLAHWSALVINGESPFNYFLQISEAVGIILNTIHRKSKNAGSKPLPYKKVLPGVNDRTYTSLFELLLQMIISSLSLSKPIQPRNKRFHQNARGGPYDNIIASLEAFGTVMSLYHSNRDLFPRRVFFSVVKSSLFVIKFCDHHLRYCVEWRSSRRITLEVASGNDLASVKFLQPLIDCVASQCIGSIFLLCNTVKQSSKDIRQRYLDCSYKHTKASAGLLYRCEGIKETIQSICQSQNLIPPVHDFINGSIGSTKRKPTGDNGTAGKRQRCHRRGTNNAHLSQSVLELVPGVECDKLNDMLNGNGVNYSESSHSDEENKSPSDSDDEGSFGAIGDWGNDT